MARGVIPVTQLSRSGVAPPAQTDANSTDDHYIDANDGLIILEIQNTGGSSATVDIDTPGTVDGLALANLQITIPNGTTRMAGPFPPAIYNQSNGQLWLDPSVSTTLKFRAYRVS